MFPHLKLSAIGLGLFGLGVWWFLDGLNNGEWSQMMGPRLVWKGPILSLLGALIFGYAFWIAKYRYLKQEPTDQEMEKAMQIALRDLMQIEQRPNQVEFDDESLMFSHDGMPVNSIRWNELKEVSIQTTEGDPATEDVFFEFAGLERDHKILLPQTSEGVDQLLRRLQGVPGFEHQAVIDAMASTEQAKYICWKA
jgi:hypothetical protein